MKASLLRERLHRQIDRLPDDLVEQVADFVLFLMAKHKDTPGYEEWDEQQWRDFVLEQFFREDEEVTYTLSDAKEVYRP